MRFQVKFESMLLWLLCFFAQWRMIAISLSPVSASLSKQSYVFEAKQAFTATHFTVFVTTEVSFKHVLPIFHHSIDEIKRHALILAFITIKYCTCWGISIHGALAWTACPAPKFGLCCLVPCAIQAFSVILLSFFAAYVSRTLQICAFVGLTILRLYMKKYVC